jgi:hypothetical protein
MIFGNCDLAYSRSLSFISRSSLKTWWCLCGGVVTSAGGEPVGFSGGIRQRIWYGSTDARVNRHQIRIQRPKYPNPQSTSPSKPFPELSCEWPDPDVSLAEPLRFSGGDDGGAVYLLEVMGIQNVTPWVTPFHLYRFPKQL